jgi:hypothetical protein
MPVRNVWDHRRQSVRRLLSSRRYAKAESAIGASAMLEMPRTNLNVEKDWPVEAAKICNHCMRLGGSKKPGGARLH